MKCVTTGCDKQQTGKSRYCPECKKIAHAKWRDMIASKGDDRAKREADIRAAFMMSHAAGMAAGHAHSPTPMVVQQHANMLDDSSPVVQEWHVDGGVCGFAWVNLKPARGLIAEIFKQAGAREAYGGGLSLFCHEFGQSMERKEKYCKAFVDTMRERGYTGFTWSSRMD